jgi:hypothetical protein
VCDLEPICFNKEINQPESKNAFSDILVKYCFDKKIDRLESKCLLCQVSNAHYAEKSSYILVYAVFLGTSVGFNKQTKSCLKITRKQSILLRVCEIQSKLIQIYQEFNNCTIMRKTLRVNHALPIKSLYLVFSAEIILCNPIYFMGESFS